MNPTLETIHPTDFGAGNVPHDVIAVANAGRFESAFYNEPLTNYKVGGWDRDPLQEALEFLAPAVPVADRFHYKEATHADHFIQLAGDEDVRPMGGDFGRVDTGLNPSEFLFMPHAREVTHHTGDKLTHCSVDEVILKANFQPDFHILNASFVTETELQELVDFAGTESRKT